MIWPKKLADKFSDSSRIDLFEKTVFMFMRNYKEIPPLEGAFFGPYGLQNLRFLINPPRGMMRSKTQWAFYRDLDCMMAWTTKNPIPGNHWVPLGCRALLGSVKRQGITFSRNRIRSVSRTLSRVGKLQQLLSETPRLEKTSL